MNEKMQRATAPVRRVLEQLALHSARDPRVARVYDGCDGGRPWFDAEHAVIVDAQERAELTDLTRRGEIVLHSATLLRDEITGEEGAVPGDLRSNGSWIWSDAVTYYLDNHWIAPDPELIAHLATAKTAALTHERWLRLYAAIRPDSWEEMTWPLD